MKKERGRTMTNENGKKEQVKWDYHMFFVLFSEMRREIGPASAYPMSLKGRKEADIPAKEKKVVKKVSKLLTSMTMQDVDENSVLFAYYIFTMKPIGRMTMVFVTAMYAAHKAGWWDNTGLRNYEKFWRSKGFLQELTVNGTDYWLIQK